MAISARALLRAASSKFRSGCEVPSTFAPEVGYFSASFAISRAASLAIAASDGSGVSAALWRRELMSMFEGRGRARWRT